MIFQIVTEGEKMKRRRKQLMRQILAFILVMAITLQTGFSPVAEAAGSNETNVETDIPKETEVQASSDDLSEDNDVELSKSDFSTGSKC
jgi:hypothetical protein